MKAVLKKDIFLTSLSGLTVSAVVALVFFLSARATVSSYFFVSIIVAICVSVILAVVLLPLIYHRINNSTVVSSGKYHIPLVVCGLILPLSLVAVFVSEMFLSQILNAILSAVAIVVLTLSSLTLYLCIGSIKERLFDLNSSKQERFVAIAAFLACNAFIATVFLSYNFFTDSFSVAITHGVYAASILTLVGMVATYAGSVHHIPRFIRLEPPTVLNLKQTYSRFFKPFAAKTNWSEALGFLFGATAVFVFILNLYARVGIFGLQIDFFVWAVFAFVGAFFLSFLGSEKIITGQNRIFIKLTIVLLIANVTVFAIIRTFISFEFLDTAVFMTMATIMGACSGAIWATKNLAMQEAIIQDKTISKGTVRNFYMLLIVLAFGTAVILQLTLSRVLNSTLIYSSIFVALIVFIVATAFSQKRSTLTMNTLDYITETRIAEDMQHNANVYITQLEDFPYEKGEEGLADNKWED